MIKVKMRVLHETEREMRDDDGNRKRQLLFWFNLLTHSNSHHKNGKNTNLSQEKSSHRRTPDRNEMVNAVPFKDRFLRGEAN